MKIREAESVLVTGASGFIGQHLVRRLIERGDRVSCLVRATSRFDELRPTGARLITGRAEGPLVSGLTSRRLPATVEAEAIKEYASATRFSANRCVTISAGCKPHRTSRLTHCTPSKGSRNEPWKVAHTGQQGADQEMCR